jgi:hypothetical protein
LAGSGSTVDLQPRQAAGRVALDQQDRLPPHAGSGLPARSVTRQYRATRGSMQITLIWTLHFTVGFEATTVHIGGSVRFVPDEGRLCDVASMNRVV